MSDIWQWFVSFIHSVADIVGPGPAVLLIALTVGATVWCVGMVAILMVSYRR